MKHLALISAAAFVLAACVPPEKPPEPELICEQIEGTDQATCYYQTPEE